jgi:hypothetical protein
MTSGDRDCTALFAAATPDLYRQNAFRTTGLPVTVSMRDVQRRVQELSMAKRLGLPVQQTSGGYLPLRPAPAEEDVGRAVKRLQDPETRLIDEFFWFWPRDLGAPEDEALRLLKEGRLKEACDTWTRLEQEGSQARVSTHNLAVLCHMAALDLEYQADQGRLADEDTRNRQTYWCLAYKRWKDLLSEEWFWGRLRARIRQLDDPRLTAARPGGFAIRCLRPS